MKSTQKTGIATIYEADGWFVVEVDGYVRGKWRSCETAETYAANITSTKSEREKQDDLLHRAIGRT